MDQWFTNFHNFFPLEESFFGGLSLPLPLPPQPQPQPQLQPLPEPPMAMAAPMVVPLPLPLENHPKPNEWTFEQNKLFENAVADIDPLCSNFFELIAAQVPGKSVGDVKEHYASLVFDLEMIESGNIPAPDYLPMEAAKNPSSSSSSSKKGKGKGVVKDVGSSSSTSSQYSTKTKKNGQPRRKSIPWTEDEHMLFLMGLNRFGKGDWVSISRCYLNNKTPTQIASHAQKYFRRQNSSTPLSRRRPSINDISTANPRPRPRPTAIPAASTYHHSYGVGAHVLRQNPPPYMASSSFFPVPLNQQWGS